MLKKRLEGRNIILASGSPRRHQFLEELDVPYEIRLKSIEEVYPTHLKAGEISDYLAELKAKPFNGTLEPKDILITSDTVVWHNGASLAKAADETEAFEMLQTLSGDWHEVITSVCFTTAQGSVTVHATTKVKFKKLTDDEINFYIENYSPYDKAGAYGIQEWLGHIGIEELQGSYTNVMGLPTHLVYETLTNMVS
ncbi:septum formation protein Maf [Aggregatimonas sangjinii]|uniref:dTTP/UTP pyrophosphatase n=1 Tax=Aggregatimonas sangjinii TaxID=2583587 RepID=A0A5B7SRU1_9FLAO|nr:Maf family nucleotide pyrophosphatase [Aggregatimonas sangjinii]QCW99742.1 septum formation protein Maf [Aggregatimonas sangjinii]